MNGKGCMTLLALLLVATLLMGICALWMVRNDPPASPAPPSTVQISGPRRWAAWAGCV